MTRGKWVAVGVPVVAVALGALVVFLVSRGSGKSATTPTEPYIAVVNGYVMPEASWHTSQTQVAAEWARYQPSVTPGPDSVRLREAIERRLLVQEAARRGLTCSTGDGRNAVATQVAMARSVNKLDDWLAPLDQVDGILPSGYVETPEPARTPSSDDAVATAESWSPMIVMWQDSCSVGRLQSQVAESYKNERNNPWDLLRDRLWANAKITLGPDAPRVTPPPTVTPIP